MTKNKLEPKLSPSVPTVQPNRLSPPGWLYCQALLELRPFRQAFLSRLFWAALLASLTLFAVAYQFPFHKVIDLDSTRDKPLLVDYYATERYQNFVYRWTHPSSNVILPGVGDFPEVKVRVELSARPAGLPPANVQVVINDSPMAQVVVSEPRKVYEFNYTKGNRALFSLDGSKFNLWLNMEALLVKSDQRPLGVIVSRLEVEGAGLFESGRFVIPDWRVILTLAISLSLLFILGVRVGWSPLSAGGALLGLSTLLAFGLVQDRVTVTLATPLLLEATLLSYPLALLGLGFTNWWLQRKGINPDSRTTRWLVLVFVLAFTLRLVGMNHPSFQTLDHGFRIHEVAAIQQDPSLIFSRYYNINSFESVGGGNGRAVEAGQWNMKVSIPYTPLFYVMDQPLGWLTGLNEASLLHWTNNFAAWLDVSALFFLFLVVVQTLGRYGKASGVAAVLFCFFPLSYLMPSDGGYNTMLANWLMLLWMAVVAGWFYSASQGLWRPGWGATLRAGVLLALVLLAHSATLLLVTVFFGIYLLLLTVFKNPLYRPLVRRCWAMFGVGLGLSFVSYYAFYAVSLVTTTLPAMLDEISQGKQIGSAAMTLRGFWPTLEAHFHLFPFLLTVAVLVVLVGSRIYSAHRRPTAGGFCKVLQAEVSLPALLFYISWLLTFFIFSILATKINLLQKEMLFALPLFAVGTGLSLTVLGDGVRHFVAGRLSISPRLAVGLVKLTLVVVVVWFVLAGTYTWYVRAIQYVLPAGTG